MLRAGILMTVVVALSAYAGGRKKSSSDDDEETHAKHKRHDAYATVVLNGDKTDVHWTDGDSFKIRSGPYKGHGTRLQRYNTLEAYGPVHRWGEWTAQELFEIAEQSASKAATQEWACTTDGKEDGYHRLLIDCPELAKFMVREGYAMAYAVDGAKPDPDVVSAQQAAIKDKAGMWKKGVVKGVISSLHSIGEEEGSADVAYNRVVNTADGTALKREHHAKYDTCQEVCETTDGEKSCMIYVPFERRYKNQPPCLR
jgi:endonuclease YncB( thermonuclease family)